MGQKEMVAISPVAAGASRAGGHASSSLRAVTMRASIEMLGSDAVVLELAAALE